MDLSAILISEVQKRPALWNLKGKAYHNRIIVDRDWKKVAEITGLTVGISKVRWKNLRDHFRKELQKQQRAISEGGEQQMSKWVYFTSLLFLKNVLKPKRLKGNPPGMAKHYPGGNSSVTDGAPINTAFAEDDDSGDFELPRTGSVNVSVEDKAHVAMSAQPQTLTTFNLEMSSTNKKCKSERESKDGDATETASNFEGQVLEMESDRLSLPQSQEDDDLNFLKSLLPYMKSLPPIRKLMVRSQFQNVLVQELMNVQSNLSVLLPPSSSCVQISQETITSLSQN